MEWTSIIGEIAGSDHDNFLDIDLYEKGCVHEASESDPDVDTIIVGLCMILKKPEIRPH